MSTTAPHTPATPGRLSRRAFLGRAAAAAPAALAVPWIIPASARAATARTVPPSERIGVAVIGCGMMGAGHVNVCLGNPGFQLLAVCDVDRGRRETAKQRAESVYAAQTAAGTYHGCAAVNDYRELLARPDLDAVLIATPDHWHAQQAADAARAGKDVYCEKPISVTLAEGRRLAEVVRTGGCVFQTGTQYRSMPPTRRVCEFVRAGGLGRVTHAFALWSRVEGSFAPINPHLPAEPVPDGLDWELWVGPAPWHDYNSRYHRNPMPGVVPWAFCEDFGVASVTWHHSHSSDVIQYALGVETSGPVEIIHPASGQFPTLTYRYANGTLLHLVEHWGVVKDVYKAVPANANLGGNFGGLFVGERGWVTSMYGAGPIQAEPESLFAEMALQSRDITGANGHHGNWLDCIRTRGRPSADEEIGHRGASLGHLAIAAFRLRRSLKWDPEKEQFIGDDQANRLRSRARREPWRL